MNYFELFNLPLRFELDLEQLAATYRQLQKQFHPDKFAAAPERERLLAMQRAAEINAAFNTLKAPLSRAEYLLALQGLDIRGEQQTLQDPAFLMQQLEWREELAELGEAEDPQAAAQAFADTIAASERSLLAELVTTLAAQQWQDAADRVRKLKFMHKLQDELERFEDSLLDF